MTAEDDEEARRQRAEQLRRISEELASDEETERPPQSPHEFIEQEMRDRGEEPREDSDDSDEGDDDDRVRPRSD